MNRDKGNSNSIYSKTILYLLTNINVFLLKIGINMKPNLGKETDIIKRFKLVKIRFHDKFDIHEIAKICVRKVKNPTKFSFGFAYVD